MSVPDSLPARFARARDTLLLRDAARLSRQLAAARGNPRFDVARFERDLAAAELAAENRAGWRPAAIEFPAELPVVQAKDEILDAIRAHPVIVLCGETGSGKTTQLPKLCLALGRGQRGLIGHTQPRRLAARSVAHRIAQELGGKLGDTIGYETRFDRRVGERTLVKLMTDGILLAELARDRDLLAYDTIIIDEAHERSLNIDFLLGCLKRLLPKRPDLKLIITSATLDPDKLAAHFRDAEGRPAPVLKVEGRTYPVEIRYQPPDDDDDLEAQVSNAIDGLWQGRPGGDVLVFLPGEREINDLARSLPGRFPRAEVLPLYSRLPAERQDRVFGRGTQPRIVLATNVAETSVTVPGIRYVVDTGTARINRYAPRTGVQLLQIEAIAQAAANQRAGRCGRVGPGICVRLYDEDSFKTRPAFTDPEVLRANLAGVILQMATLNLGDVDDFPWLDAPEGRHIAEGYRLLQTLGAFEGGDGSDAGPRRERRLTPLGRALGRLPLDPRIARIVLAADGRPWADAVHVLAAALSVQDPHDVPPDQQTQARQKHAEWRHPKSDFLTLLQLWARWRDWSGTNSNRALRKLCKAHYVSYLRMAEWDAVYRQIADMTGRGADKGTGNRPAASGNRRTADAAATAPAATATTTATATAAALPSGTRSGPSPDSPAPIPAALYAPLHQALLAGLIDHIGLRAPTPAKDGRPEYSGPRGRRFRLFPGSAIAKKPPPWVMSAQLAQTSQLFARVNAEIQPEWLAEVAPHLVKRTLLHPEWNPERGEVIALETITLFGLPVLRRGRSYGSVAPAEAREIFIRDALVRGEMPNKPAFLEKNLALCDAVRDKEARLRRPDLLADEAQFFAFYDAVLPPEICTTAALKSWLRREVAMQRRLTMAEADALKPGADADVERRFPDTVTIAGRVVPVSYSHEPGAEEDGVSFEIPLTWLFALPAERFDWLVPGLLPARIEALIRSLPMNLRRQCTPAADYARAIAEAADPDSGPLLDAICHRFADMNGVTLRPEDFDASRLEAHLRPRLVLIDESGRTVDEAETLGALQARRAGDARQALIARAQAHPDARRWTREVVLDWDFGALPAQVALGAALAYPALIARDDGGVGLRLLESAETAREAHAAGCEALLLTRVADRLRDLARTVRGRLGIALAQTGLSAEALAREVARRAARSVWAPAEIRDAEAFQAAVNRRAEFGREAVRRLDEVIGWLESAMALRKRLDGALAPWPQAEADLRGQLSSLFAPGFIAAIPDAQWPRIATYLKAATVRADRVPHKPQRDAEMLAQLKPWLAKLPGPFHPARWVLEEWRIALFAQELKALGSPSAVRLQAALAE